MVYKYSTKTEEMHAKAVALSVSASTKHCLEIASYVKNRPIDKAIRLLEGVVKKDIAVPFKRFNGDVGHRRGKIAAGRYPIKAAEFYIKLLKSVKSNALEKGMNEKDLFISAIVVNKASVPMRYGRQRGRKSKRTHIEVVVIEKEQPKKEDKKKKVDDKKAEKPKAEPKKTEPEAEVKAEVKEKAEAPKKEAEKKEKSEVPAKEEPKDNNPKSEEKKPEEKKVEDKK